MRARYKAKKAEFKSEELDSSSTVKDDDIQIVEIEENKKNEMTKVHTAPAKLGVSKETTDEWGQLRYFLPFHNI